MYTQLIGVSPEIKKIKEIIDHVADTNLNVVITGETGVGKEVVARVLYQQSPRNTKPFVKVNCAALPDGLLESELYGYEQGAFTGAERKKKGKFELAHKGVLFLDEIGDMSLPLQAKLLHVLQSGEFAPLGSEKEVKSDTWVIAATNHDLSEKINDKTFRADLYYRLNIIKIYIPPLRERPEDILELINYYSEQLVTQFSSKNIKHPNKSTIDTLLAYHWPGNVRQLQNILKRILILGDGRDVLEELSNSESEFPDQRSDSKPNREQESASVVSSIGFLEEEQQDISQFSLKNIRKKALDKIERDAIVYVLNKTNWNRSKAAKILQVSYKTLLYKISELNIEQNHNGE
jgi:transcriptional regulator with GAF, ATPase, and Fis domain